jgi:hypothetical protein
MESSAMSSPKPFPCQYSTTNATMALMILPTLVTFFALSTNAAAIHPVNGTNTNSSNPYAGLSHRQPRPVILMIVGLSISQGRHGGLCLALSSLGIVLGKLQGCAVCLAIYWNNQSPNRKTVHLHHRYGMASPRLLAS